MNQRAGREYRVTRREEITRVFEAGNRANDGYLTLLALRRDDLTPPRARVAVAPPKKYGKAVRRNRIKRLCREAFRNVRARVPSGWDYVIVPRAGREPALEDLKESIIRLSSRVTGRET